MGKVKIYKKKTMPDVLLSNIENRYELSGGLLIISGTSKVSDHCNYIRVFFYLIFLFNNDV